MADHRVDGKTLNIASGYGTSVNELTDAMLDVTRSALRPRTCPADWTAGSRRVGDPQLAATELGWTAETPLAVGLQRCWDSIEGRADV